MGIKDQKKMKAGLKWLAWSAILSGVSAGSLFAYGWWQTRPPEAIPVRLLAAELGTIEIMINESGVVELGSQQTLKSPEEGAVEQVLVKLGDQVVAGQPLLTLRNPERQTIIANQLVTIQTQEIKIARHKQAVREAEEKLAREEANLATQLQERDLSRRTQVATKALEIKEQKITIASARQRVLNAQENLKEAERKLAQLETVYQKGYIAGQEIDDQKNNVRTAQSELRDAQLTLEGALVKLQNLQTDNLLELEPIQNGVPQAEIDLRQAQTELATSLQELAANKLDLQKEQEKLQNYIVKAPINGVVLDIKIKNGDGVQRATELLTLGNPAQELVKLSLSTLNAAKVRPNQEARISIIGPNAKPFPGRVESISLQATSGSSQDSSSSESPVSVPAIVRLNTPTGTLIPGSQVSVDIVLQQKQNVIALQTDAIQQDGSSAYIWVKDAQNQAQKRPVKLGLEGLTEFEITSGLRPGEKVILPPAETPLEPGMPVTELKAEDDKTGDKPVIAK